MGWEYSAFVFLGINLTLLLMIAILYSALLFSIWRTRRQCATTSNLLDCEFAIRFVYFPLAAKLFVSRQLFQQIFLHRFNGLELLGTDYYAKVFVIAQHWILRRHLRLAGGLCAAIKLCRKPFTIHIQHAKVSWSDLRYLSKTKYQQKAGFDIKSRSTTVGVVSRQLINFFFPIHSHCRWFTDEKLSLHCYQLLILERLDVFKKKVLSEKLKNSLKNSMWKFDGSQDGTKCCLYVIIPRVNTLYKWPYIHPTELLYKPFIHLFLCAGNKDEKLFNFSCQKQHLS